MLEDKRGQMMKKSASNSIDESAVLQNTVRELLKELNWDIRHLAKEMCDDKSYKGVSDADINEEKEYEKIKKRLSRPTTKLNLLQELINFMLTHKDGKKLNRVRRLPNINPDYFSDNEKEILKDIAEISKNIFEQENGNV